MERLNGLPDMRVPCWIGDCRVAVFAQQITGPLSSMARHLGYYLAVVTQNFAVSTSQAVVRYFFSAGFNSTVNVAGAYLYIAPVELSVVEPNTPPIMMFPQNTGSNAVSATIVFGS